MLAQIADAESGDFLTAGRRDNTRAFRAAVRHSRLVRLLRIAVPAMVVGFSTLFLAYWWFDPLRALSKLPVGGEGVVLSGTKVIMNEPRLNGFTQDQRPYTLVARTAAKDLTRPDELELQDLRGTMIMPDRRNVQVTARIGFYDAKADTVRLRNDVIVSSPEYEALMSEALMHIRKGHVISEQPVVINMQLGTINANRLEIEESGAIIRFERGVTVLIDREDPPANATRESP